MCPSRLGCLQSMPTSKQCPFKEITIEGVRQSIKKGVVNLAGTPSGWSGTFRWNVGDTTPEEFEKRIMEQLLREPTGSLASSTPTYTAGRRCARADVRIRHTGLPHPAQHVASQ